MKKVFALQLMIAFSCFSLATLHAQDSVRRSKPAAAKISPAYKAPIPASKYAAKKAATPYPSATKTDSARTNTGIEAPSDKSLSGQYRYLLTKVYNYQQPLLGAYHKSIMDTLTQARRALKDVQVKLSTSTQTIDSLQKTIKISDQTLTESNQKVNAIDLLGATIPKSTYNLIMWGLVIAFGAIAAVVIARSGSYSREAKYRTQLYNELEEEYRVFKAKANEKEKKLARELQTERNKLDDMLGNQP